jgi:SAM-dependent methyltransferase
MILQRVKSWVPPKVKLGLRDSYYYLQEVRNGLFAGDTLAPPLHAKGYVGDGEFEKIGSAFVNYFLGDGGLSPTDHVLDIGCGIGRMALPLTRVLKSPGSYDGFDVFPYGIGWCRRKITARHSNFRFHHFDLSNTAYNRGGGLDPAAFSFPFESGTFDFAFATSVFTHLTRPTTENYIREVSRTLRPGGRLVATFFLLNEGFRAKATAGKTKFVFDHEVDGCFVNDPKIIEGIVGYDQNTLLDLFSKNGFELEKPIAFGSWAGGQNGVSSQDIVVARKVAQLS